MGYVVNGLEAEEALQYVSGEGQIANTPKQYQVTVEPEGIHLPMIECHVKDVEEHLEEMVI